MLKFSDFYIQDLDERKRTLKSSVLRQLFVINPFMALVFVLIYYNFDHFGRNLAVDYLIASIISLVITITAYGSKSAFALFQKFRRRPNLQISKTVWFGISLLAMPVGLKVAQLVMPVLAPQLGLGPVEIPSEGFRTSMVIGGLIGAVFFVAGIFLDTKKSLVAIQLNLKHAENQHLQSQISALTAQMNPHLLFNALNTVASLVATDPAKAEATIVTLSELYRGVLNSSKTMIHSLRTEIELCEAYLNIEKARFGDRVRARILIDDKVCTNTSQVPSLCLQPLVENAVKHGLAKQARGGTVWITVAKDAGHLALTVEDDGAGWNHPGHHPSKGTGTGLLNCRERLRLHYGELSSFQVGPRPAGGTKVQLRIPWTNPA